MRGTPPSLLSSLIPHPSSLLTMSDAPRRAFRWQALLQGADDALFVLDRRRRVLFVNAAFERLVGLTLGRVRGLSCRRPAAPGPDDPVEDHAAHLMSPPPAALDGTACRARRLLPSPAPLWIDLDFLPVRQEGEGLLILGRAVAVPPTHGPPAALPERLVGLRHSRAGEFALDLLGPPSALLHRQALLAAGLTCPVMLRGEPGTGRATFARIVHHHGPHRERPLAVLDCARLPARAVLGLVLETRGDHAPAAFHLREPGRLPADAQAKIAAWLAAGHGPRLYAGCSTPPVPPLAEALAVLTVDLPPLRSCKAELPRFAEWMLARLNDEGGVVITGLSPPAWDILRAHDWPGNLAELFDVLRGARRRAAGPLIEREHLPMALRVAEEPAPPAVRPLDMEGILAEAERRLIRLALERAGGNRTRAAELLSVPRARLLRRIEALGLGGDGE